LVTLRIGNRSVVVNPPEVAVHAAEPGTQTPATAPGTLYWADVLLNADCKPWGDVPDGPAEFVGFLEQPDIAMHTETKVAIVTVAAVRRVIGGAYFAGTLDIRTFGLSRAGA
jgi:hypothetical protein